MNNNEDIIQIENQSLSFEEIFEKKIDYSSYSSTHLNNKVILITGGAGSIGSSLLYQLLQQNIKKIIILDNSEYGIFNLSLKFEKFIKAEKLILILGDIKNEDNLKSILSLHNIQIIYHIAAYKHIHLLEKNITEGIEVNIKSSINLFKIASNSKSLEQFIFISTDKAVNPINSMGMSKRIVELFLIKLLLSQPSSFLIKIIRFGNVFNSSGSVFEIFKYQIENKLPITITNKEMKRYFISKYQASLGLIKILEQKNSSGIYLLNMGESIKIEDIIHKILSKLELNYTPKIKYLYKKTSEIINEKIEEELNLIFEITELENQDFRKINLNFYNLNLIKKELNNYNKILKNNIILFK